MFQQDDLKSVPVFGDGGEVIGYETYDAAGNLVRFDGERDISTLCCGCGGCFAARPDEAPSSTNQDSGR